MKLNNYSSARLVTESEALISEVDVNVGVPRSLLSSDYEVDDPVSGLHP
jgi:hypothetical protein